MYRIDMNSKNEKITSFINEHDAGVKEQINKAIGLAKLYLKSENTLDGYNQSTSSTEYDHIDELGRFIIHVYNINQNQTNTIAWLIVDLQNNKVNLVNQKNNRERLKGH